MAHKTYDAIIIGGGLNGTCLSAYLQRAGMQVAVFERRHEEGSGIHTMESVPGFLFNHAQYNEFFPAWAPPHVDLGLEALGARFIYPEAQAGIAFSDGRPPIVLYNVDMDPELSRKSIAVHSRHDADTFVELRMRGNAAQQLFYAWAYNPPQMPSERDPDPWNTLSNAFMDLFGLPRHLAKGTARDVIEYLFESPEIRTFLYKMAPEWLTAPEMMGGGAMGLISLFPFSQNWRLSVGGTHTVAHAMAMAAIREGVHFHESSRVTKIVVRNGRACGVLLADGTEVEAKRLVVSSADVRQTVLQLMGDGVASPLWMTRARNIKYGPHGVLGSSQMALHEAPDYRSARHDAAINKTFYTVVGFDEPDEVLEHCREYESGKIPTVPGIGVAVNSLWDPTYAPPGKHSFCGWLFMPKASALSRKEWQEVKTTYNDRILERIRRWAPNMTRRNVVGDCFYTPLDLQEEKFMVEGDYTGGMVVPGQIGHQRPFPEAATYRAEVEGLYLCGSGMHPMGGISACVGYNVYKVLTEDFGLAYKPWEKSGRGY